MLKALNALRVQLNFHLIVTQHNKGFKIFTVLGTKAGSRLLFLKTNGVNARRTFFNDTKRQDNQP